MSTRIPPLHALRAFEAAARHASFTRAAEELCVTRSAISHRIQLLEELIGTPLFQRKGQALALTGTGNAYLASVRKALESLRDIALPATGRDTGTLPVSVAAPPTFARVVLVPKLSEFLAAHPGVELTVHVSAPMLDSCSCDADVKIRFGRGAYPGMESHVLLDEPVFPVCSPGYAERVGLAGPADLARAVLLRSSLEPWQPWLTAAGLQWGEPAIGPRFEDLALLYQAAANGQGVALARSILAASALESGSLTTLFGIAARSPHAYYVVYAKHAADQAPVAAFIDWLRGAIPAVAADANTR